MPPKQKVHLDKVAWQWADSVDHTRVTEEHVRMAYRLNLTACEKGTCKRNCKGNPFCLHSLGEKKWYGTVDESKWQNFDPEVERRQQGHFVGLKNLGATCYVNTFLQLWFHNPSVRRAVYEWRDTNLPEDYYEGWKPDTICGHLQVIFGLLQCSNRCYVDPSPLIECLGLDAGEQQDAQEFSKLFLHVLESSLSGDVPGKENVIEQQFCGKYCYVTICQNCGSQSETPATFYELDLNIRGHSTLAASIKDFLQEEKLEGDNQYMCSICNSKQNATRVIRLKQLPPVLNLQLLRFVFDKNKGHKKKLSSFIQFPESLDMSPYLVEGEGEGKEGTLYELTAVLIHRGPSAYSGHYIAHIRDEGSGAWYKYNDEEIEKMNSKKLELGKEEDVVASEGSSEKAPKASKGSHNSRHAYMLVYRRCRTSDSGDKSPTASVSEALLPAAVRGFVDNDNQEFENWITEMLQTQKQNISDVKQTHEEMKTLYTALPVRTIDEAWEWVSTEWLTKWLADPSSIEKVKNKIPRCPHGKLLPEDVFKMKCISSEGAELLFTKYPIDKRYKGESLLCEKCIRQKCREIRFRKCMTDDDKLFSSTKNIITIDPSEEYFWVSTKHLRSWKKFAMGEIAGQPVSVLSSPVKSEAECSSSGEVATSFSLSGKQEDSSSSSVGSGNDSNPNSNTSITCTSVGDDLKREENLTFEDASSVSLLSSTSSSPPSSSTSPSVLAEKSSETKRISSPPSASSPATISSADITSTSPPCPKETDANANSQLSKRKSRKRSSSDQLTSCSHTQSQNVSSESIQLQNNTDSCESPDSGTIVLTKTITQCCDMVTDIQDRLSPDSSTHDPMDVDKHNEISASGSRLCNGGRDEQSGKSESQQRMSDTQKTEFDGVDADNDDEEDDDEKEEKFNDDILCDHGNLKIDENGRRVVPRVVWERLLYYFPHLKPFTLDSLLCEECLAQQEFQQQMKESRKLAGQDQKDMLHNLYHGKNRPKIGEPWHGRVAYVVSSNFVEGWRKFVKHSVKSESVQEIVNAPLLCEHNLLLYKPEDMNPPDNATRFTLVWQDEWDKLTGFFAHDVEIQVIQLVEDDGRLTVVTDPAVCSTCLNERIRQEEEGKYIFTKQVVYVRKIVDGAGLDNKGDDAKENGKGYNYDPEFNAPPQQKGRGRGSFPPPEKQAKLDNSGQRKSSRHRKTRGEKEVVVSSSMTLKELKIELFKVCSVPPFDQNLSLDGKSLKNDEATLQELRVYPQCVIFLKADEPTGEATTSVDDFLSVPTGPEEGFKGTNLLGR